MPHLETIVTLGTIMSPDRWVQVNRSLILGVRVNPGIIVGASLFRILGDSNLFKWLSKYRGNRILTVQNSKWKISWAFQQ